MLLKTHTHSIEVIKRVDVKLQYYFQNSIYPTYGQSRRGQMSLKIMTGSQMAAM